MKPEAVMIFAAGFGTRMMPLTAEKPKPMVRVNGRPMIDHALDLARNAGAKTIVCNLHYKSEVLAAHLAGKNVLTVTEWPEILDTGGGLKNARAHFKNDTAWTMNPDAIWQGVNPLTFAAEHWDPGKMDALLVCLEPKNAQNSDSLGDFTIENDGLLKRGTGVVYGGVQILKLDTLDGEPRSVFSLNTVWDKLIEKGRCCGAIYPGKWCDVGTPEGLEVAERLLQDDL